MNAAQKVARMREYEAAYKRANQGQRARIVAHERGWYTIETEDRPSGGKKMRLSQIIEMTKRLEERCRKWVVMAQPKGEVGGVNWYLTERDNWVHSINWDSARRFDNEHDAKMIAIEKDEKMPHHNVVVVMEGYWSIDT